jgi:dTDP-4-dehydrorhamnose reductase
MPLIVGADSLIGRELIRQYSAAGVPAAGTTRRRETVSDDRILLDLNSDLQFWRPPRDGRVAFLCAGVASIERCRIDPAGTRLTNVKNTITIANILLEAGYFVVFISTNLVYDGLRPFVRAEDPTNPTTEYARQKAEVEEKLLLSATVSIARVTKVLPTNASLFVDWRERLRRGEIIQPFSDAALSPVPLSFVASVLQRLGAERVQGIVQISGERDITYEDAAFMIARTVGASENQVMSIPKIGGAPRFSTLDTQRLRVELGMKPPDVESTVLRAAGV